MGGSGTARTHLANPRRCVRAEPAVGGDERVEIKEILKMMVSGTAKSAQKCKMVMLRNGFFLEICENDMLRNGNSGLKWGSLARHIPNMHMAVTPPPPPNAHETHIPSKKFEFPGGQSQALEALVMWMRSHAISQPYFESF